MSTDVGRQSRPQPAARLQGCHGVAIGVEVPLLPDGPDLRQAVIRPVGAAEDVGQEPGALVEATDDAAGAFLAPQERGDAGLHSGRRAF